MLQVAMCWLECALRNNTYNLPTMNLYILDDPDLQHCWHIVAFILLLEKQGAEHCNFTTVLIIRPLGYICRSCNARVHIAPAYHHMEANVKLFLFRIGLKGNSSFINNFIKYKIHFRVMVRFSMKMFNC